MRAAKTVLDKLGKAPDRILMIKGHSAGIGDILRSSAAWRALKTAYPRAELHLALFTREPGYASIGFIARHHLLSGFCSVDKSMCRVRAWPELAAWARQTAKAVRPDLVIDFESAGLYSALAAWRVGRASGALTAGIGEFPLRGVFYDIVSVAKSKFARRRGLEYPLEYAYRDFVCLSGLNIERNGIPIELEETDEGRGFREHFRERFHIPSGATIIGVNIGCGTPGAMGKRPDLSLLAALVQAARKAREAVVVLTGANFERDVNQAFLGLWPANGGPRPLDLAGETTLFELSGLIRACDLFVSTDSGPYHMSVALGVPTLAIFRYDNRIQFHRAEHVRCVMLENEGQLAAATRAAAELLTRRGGPVAGETPRRPAPY